MITIKRVSNGYIITHDQNYDGDTPIETQIVIERCQKDTYEMTTHFKPFTTQQLLWEIIELLNEQGSKHDPYRLKVIVEDQDGNEVEDEL